MGCTQGYKALSTSPGGGVFVCLFFLLFFFANCAAYSTCVQFVANKKMLMTQESAFARERVKKLRP